MPSTSAEVDTGEANSDNGFSQAVDGNCQSKDLSISTAYKSPYMDFCVGVETSSPSPSFYFWQLEVKFRGNVKNSIVTAKINPDKTLQFTLTSTTSNVINYSLPSKNNNFVVKKDGMGYGIEINANGKFAKWNKIIKH